MIITVLGNGGFGTAIAIACARAGNDVRVWGHDPDYTRQVASSRENPRYLPGVMVPEEIEITTDVGRALASTQAVLVAVPTQHVRGVFADLGISVPGQVPYVSLSKGLELDTGLRPSEVLAQFADDNAILALSGPSHAEEVARGLPATLVLAGTATDTATIQALQSAISDQSFRVYESCDLLGVELCGALKNVMAIAAGIAEGLGLGDNAKAATLARGLAEMCRFGEAAGARPETFMGLAGVGDLAVTAFSSHGRNRAFGERIGRGETLATILGSTHKVAEGVWTSRVVLEQAEQLGVEMPICEAVCAVLFDGVPPHTAVQNLMAREHKAES